MSGLESVENSSEQMEHLLRETNELLAIFTTIVSKLRKVGA